MKTLTEQIKEINQQKEYIDNRLETIRQDCQREYDINNKKTEEIINTYKDIAKRIIINNSTFNNSNNLSSWEFVYHAEGILIKAISTNYLVTWAEIEQYINQKETIIAQIKNAQESQNLIHQEYGTKIKTLENIFNERIKYPNNQLQKIYDKYIDKAIDIIKKEYPNKDIKFIPGDYNNISQMGICVKYKIGWEQITYISWEDIFAQG